VTANEQAFFRCAAQREPGVAGGIVVDFQRQPLGFLAQKFTGLEPNRREGDTLGAIRITGQRPKLFQFSDGALTI
jgi:hypothetical protein